MHRRLIVLTALLGGFCVGFLAVESASAVVIQDFDNPGTSYGTYGSASVVSTPPTVGNAVRLTPPTGSQVGRLGFALADVGENWTSIAGQFDFLATPASSSNQADGLGMLLIPTTGPDGQGTSGDFSIVGNAEFAQVNGGFGIGLNIHQGGADISNNSVYLSIDGATIAQVNAPFDMSTSEVHRALFSIDFLAGGGANVSLSLIQDIYGLATGPSAPQAVYTDYNIPALNPYEFRAGFAARTGGQVADQRVDNIRINAIVPEPATVLVWSLLAGLGVGLGWRRRK